MFVELLVVGLLALASNVDAQCTVEAITNGTPSPVVGQNVTDGGTLTVTCEAGYVTSPASVTCSGTAFNATLTCDPIICAATTITNGIGTTADTAYNGTHTFSCNAGYVISGTANLTCDGTESDNWSAPVPSCVAATCNAPPTTLNQGSFPTMPKGGYNGTVEIICDPGYEAGSTNSSLCTDTNTWNPDTLTCVAITCAALTVANGATSTDTTAATAFNTSVTVTCDTGFKLSSSGALVCDGTTLDNWNVVIPTCDAITCAALTVANGATSTDTTVATAFNTSVTVTCDTGFKLSSSGALVCDGTRSDNWNIVIPTCDENGGPALFKLQTALMVTVLSMITWLSTQTALL